MHKFRSEEAVVIVRNVPYQINNTQEITTPPIHLLPFPKDYDRMSGTLGSSQPITP